jgi:hypothetical protein
MLAQAFKIVFILFDLSLLKEERVQDEGLKRWDSLENYPEATAWCTKNGKRT